jgi:hypothetical protein
MIGHCFIPVNNGTPNAVVFTTAAEWMLRRGMLHAQKFGKRGQAGEITEI